MRGPEKLGKLRQEARVGQLEREEGLLVKTKTSSSRVRARLDSAPGALAPTLANLTSNKGTQ